MTASEQIILVHPHPRTVPLILTDTDKRRLEQLGSVVYVEQPESSEDTLERCLPNLVALVGQTPMDAARLHRAPHLRAIFNVEGNFLPNVDYALCHQRNIHVLSCAPAFATSVAEMALGMALASARGVLENDASFRRGAEIYGGASNREAFLLRGKSIGLLGCGNVGRALLPLLRPFVFSSGEILAHDPWVHEHVLRELGTAPVPLDELFRRSRVVFIISAATNENKGAIGREQLQKMQPGALVVVVGRSDVLDFDALLDLADRGHLRVAIDVFPEEPLPKDHRVRQTRNTILSAHRAGGVPESYHEIGRMVVDDLESVLKGLPPQRMQRALPETVARYRGRPVSGVVANAPG